jgi:hypothetical protein
MLTREDLEYPIDCLLMIAFRYLPLAGLFHFRGRCPALLRSDAHMALKFAVKTLDEVDEAQRGPLSWGVCAESRLASADRAGPARARRNWYSRAGQCDTEARIDELGTGLACSASRFSVAIIAVAR